MNKKVIGTGIVGLICVCIIVVGKYLTNPSEAKVIARDGTVLAYLQIVNGELEYNCESNVRAYVDYACDEAVELIAQKEDISKEKARELIVEKNYTIETVFEDKLFRAVSDACNQYSGYGDEGMVAAISDGRGHLLAAYAIGGQDADNLLLKKNYAGSTMKPLSTYGPAIESDVITWSSMYEDSPYMETEDSGEWPVNTTSFTWKEKSAAQGLVESNNAITVKILSDLGIKESCDFLKNTLGLSVDREQEWIKEDMKEYEQALLSDIGLGYLEQGVSMVEMLENYQVFAQGGIRYELSALAGVTDAEGDRIAEPEEICVRVFSEDTAYILNRMLSEAVKFGTGQTAQLEGIDVCGKTGTSENYQDNWFIGMTPEYVCGVWYGISNNERLQNDAINVFYNVMSHLELDESKKFPVSENVEEKRYCLETGLLAGDNCELTGIGYYKKNNQPDICNR